MTNTKMTLVDWLDDLCVRFIVNLPNEELQSVERICFQIEEAQWFYEDFVRPLDPNNLPSMHLRKFSQLMFQHCPLFSAYPPELHQQAYEQFLAYKTRVPVRGAIMLDQDMTHAVLVKGWKKGAKWSFPRGKINNMETDLDCAIREVWEETGYDLREANLVQPEEDMKKITVTMREQSMMLYVFRGVPTDTYFEPRTRKEISKIDWYKLTDLPTLRRKNQVQQPGTGQDLIKESSFYMVAPFLGPLRSWIKQQHKLDKQNARNSAYLAPPPVLAAVTDDEDLQPDARETAAEEVTRVAEAHPDDSFEDLVARMGREHRPSETAPEVSMQPSTNGVMDPAEELKRLLSVGMGTQSPPTQGLGLSTPSAQPQANTLLSLFQQGNGWPDHPQMPMPRTPFDQVMPPPVQPHNPHGQHHPRPPQMGNMGPPPPFPFPPNHGMPFRGPQPPSLNGMHAQMPNMPVPPAEYYRNQIISRPTHAPDNQQAFGQHHQHPYQQINNGHAIQPQSFHTSQSQSFGAHGAGPAIPPASKLPTPKMNAHTMGLLNAFKTNDQRPVVPSPSQTQSSQTTPRVRQQAHPQHQPNELASPHFQSPPINIQPAQPQPRSTHHDSLLNLFRGTPPIPSPEPAELSAHPLTPGFMSTQPAMQASKPFNAEMLAVSTAQSQPAGITSATVRGPVNAPDFETMKRSTHQHMSGSSRGPSPATFMPQQILKREPASSAPRSPADLTKTGPTGAPLPPATASGPSSSAFKPQILKRPQQPLAKAVTPVPAPSAHAMGLLSMFKGPSPQPAPSQHAPPAVHSPVPPAEPSVFEGFETLKSDQKRTLLELFGKSSPKPGSPRLPVPLQQTHSPSSLARSTLPPTPKTGMPGMISPVSPLPEKSSRTASPADHLSRSRISSIGDAIVPGVLISPTSHPATIGENSENIQSYVSASGLSAQSKSGSDARSPVDKTFLLGFLEDVARRGR
jgi:mRNA-decapping enzyme subunit 2